MILIAVISVNSLSPLIGIIDVIRLFPPNYLEFSRCSVCTADEWMSEWRHGGAPFCLSHQTCPLQSWNTYEMGVAPQTIFVLSVSWFTQDLPPVRPQLTAFLHWPSAHPNGSAHCQWNIVTSPYACWLWFQGFHFLESPPPAPAISGISPFGPGLAPVFSLFALTLSYGFSLRIPERLFCLIHLWFTMYHLVCVFHWFLNTDPCATYFSIFWTGMHIQLMMLVQLAMLFFLRVKKK